MNQPINFLIRQMQRSDIEGIATPFALLNKSRDQYETFWKEHSDGKRVTFVALVHERVVGYTNLLWQSDYPPFQEKGIAEINNMHVLDAFQKRGIGTALIREAERIALAHGKDEIGSIGFGLTADYGTAQRLYPKLSYFPDGLGAFPTLWGDVLYLIKKLK